jgi:pyridoxal phosphate enzyme (YggS family)
VRLLAVAKNHPAAAIRAAYALGQRAFGENYVQECKRKAEALADLPDLELRLIGRLQRNKAKDAVRLVRAVDSVDSLELAQALSQHAAALGRPLTVLLQVNLDREPQKAGVFPEAAPGLAEQVRTLPALTLAGVMAIPRATDEPEQTRPAFAALAQLAARLGLPEVSMGMSGDFEIAIEEGATLVRVGTAIFGART